MDTLFRWPLISGRCAERVNGCRYPMDAYRSLGITEARMQTLPSLRDASLPVLSQCRGPRNDIPGYAKGDHPFTFRSLENASRSLSAAAFNASPMRSGSSLQPPWVVRKLLGTRFRAREIARLHIIPTSFFYFLFRRYLSNLLHTLLYVTLCFSPRSPSRRSFRRSSRLCVQSFLSFDS